jgi:hypothetical protein
MLTNKITGFSADLLNTVRGILGEAKKCSKGCECEKCQAEEMKEGSMPTADEPTDANKKTADKVRAMMAKEKKPVKEGTKEDLPFEGPYRKAGEERKDEFGNKVKNVAKHLAKKAMNKQKNEEIDPDLEAELKATRVTKKSIADSQKTRERASRIKEDSEHTNCGTPECCGECDTAEQIDEISKAKLGRYINKAKDSIDMTSYRSGIKDGTAISSSKPYTSNNPLEKKLSKRHKGIETAVKKLTKEESEQIDEATYFVHTANNAHHVNKKIPTGKKDALGQALMTSKVVKSFPYGDSQSKQTSSDQHKAAYAHAKKLNAGMKNEEVEQIDELSKATMGRYINKAATKMGSQGVTAGLKIAADEKSSKNFKDMGKREKGIKLAVSKLTKEEQDFIDSLNDADIEQIDEISKDAALKYLSANKKDDAKARETGDYDRMTKRMRGTDMAVRKYTAKPGSKYVRVPATEEVEIAEARGRPRKAGAKDFTIHPKTKEKLMHNNPEHMKKIEALQKNKVLEKPKIEAGQHIMNQLQKAKTSMLGGSTIHFTHGDSKHVSGTHAAKLLSKYAGMKPNEKEDFQKKIGHSHEQLMKHV